MNAGEKSCGRRSTHAWICSGVNHCTLSTSAAGKRTFPEYRPFIEGDEFPSRYFLRRQNPRFSAARSRTPQFFLQLPHRSFLITFPGIQMPGCGGIPFARLPVFPQGPFLEKHSSMLIDQEHMYGAMTKAAFMYFPARALPVT